MLTPLYLHYVHTASPVSQFYLFLEFALLGFIFDEKFQSRSIVMIWADKIASIPNDSDPMVVWIFYLFSLAPH